jgi:hypothetical protein
MRACLWGEVQDGAYGRLEARQGSRCKRARTQRTAHPETLLLFPPSLKSKANT